MATLFNRVGVSTATAGAGTITLGAALASGTSINSCSFQTAASAGTADGQTVSYLLLDSNGNWEYGTGTYTAAGTTLTRTLGQSNTGALISLSGTAQVFLTARAADILNPANNLSDVATAATALSNIGGAPTTRNLTAAGLVTGGGTLAADRTFTVTAAVQADQETGTSTTVAVVPGVQKFHPSACKAWATWGVTSTIDASFNVSSITDNGAGDWTVNFTTVFSSANYGWQYTIQVDEVGTADGSFDEAVKTTGIAAGSLRVVVARNFSGGLALTDDIKNSVACFGDQ